MDEVKKTREHWDRRAAESKAEMGNTLSDETFRTLEIEAIVNCLNSGEKILDIGCGNGYSTIQFAKMHELRATGIDYSEAMVRNAQKLLERQDESVRNRVEFRIGDVLADLGERGGYDTIITERCLINLGSWELQQRALENIHAMLPTGGRFLMLEGFEDNLATLNTVRDKLGLKPIQVVWHNIFFLRERFESFISDLFDIEHRDNFGSTYMLITRSYLHAIQEEKGVFNKEWDRLAALLPNFGDYNYQQLYVLRKK